MPSVSKGNKYISAPPPKENVCEKRRNQNQDSTNQNSTREARQLEERRRSKLHMAPLLFQTFRIDLLETLVDMPKIIRALDDLLKEVQSAKSEQGKLLALYNFVKEGNHAL
ncbi:hypothetical protein JTB14_037258 [Gonioctena quinquepunctata]|nr:hypothetical protein JTB14_037258 [Gonioctena quinquepunctata]